MRRFWVVAGLVSALSLGVAAAGLGGTTSPAAMPTYVTVPDEQYGNVLAVYQELHGLGLRVSIRNSFLNDWLCTHWAVDQMPRAGAIVKRGSTVTVSVDGCQLGRGPISNIAHAVVPFLIGRTVTAAWIWVYKQDMLFRAKLGPLRDATKPRLYDNYRIIRQSPGAGSKLSRFEGVCGDLACGLPTPLTVWGKQFTRPT